MALETAPVGTAGIVVGSADMRMAVADLGDSLQEKTFLQEKNTQPSAAHCQVCQ